MIMQISPFNEAHKYIPKNIRVLYDLIYGTFFHSIKT